MITVTIEEEPVGTKDIYPMLKITEDGEMVLFTNEKTGTLITPGKFTKIVGYYTDDWIESHFTPFTGKITLSNL